MIHGKEVKLRMTGGKDAGLPFCAILAAGGQLLASSDGPEGNIGCPVQPAERAHFNEMLKTTALTLSDAERQQIGAELDRFAESILNARKRRED